MTAFANDLRLAIRSLSRQPSFAAVAILTLALGIGATSAMFSVFKAVVLHPLPFPEPSRLVMVWEHNFAKGVEENFVSTANYREWEKQHRLFGSLSAYWLGTVSMIGQGEPEELKLGAATGTFFSTLGARPLLGRALAPGDDVQGSPDVAVLSYALWQRKFGGDRNVIGRTVQMYGSPFTIVGVMRPDFVLPLALSDGQADVWMGLSLPDKPLQMSGRFLRVIGRLAPGVQLEQARREMAALARRLAVGNPLMHNYTVNVVPLHEQLVGKVRRPLIIILASVGILLLIACVNVANLLLSRASSRRKEMAIRAALGASRWRLVRQLLTESLVLSVAGGAVGLLFAVYGTTLLVRLIPDATLLPRLEQISVDAATISVTALIAIATAMLFGLAPAVDASRTDLQNVLRSSSRGATHGRGGKQFRDALVASEIALAVVLLVSAGLLLKSFRELLDVDPGVSSEHALTMKVAISSASYKEPHTRIAFYDRLFDRVRAIPGVTAVGATQHMPFTGPGRVDSFTIEGRPPADPGQKPGSDMRSVAGDYFRAMGMKLYSGRFFEARDATRRTYVVNTAFVKQYFPNENPLGQRLTITWDQDPTTGEIVGVVDSVRAAGLEADAAPAMYVNYALSPVTKVTLIARSNGDLDALAGSITKIVRQMDPSATVSQVRTLDGLVLKTIARPKFNASLLTIFSAMGLILAAIGIYGVLSFSVSQRTQEIGVRMALGAQPRQVMKLISREGMKIALLGLLIGTAGALAATRLLRSLLFGVSASDPAVMIFVWIGVLLVAFLATYVPARRATRVDPLIALRAE